MVGVLEAVVSFAVLGLFEGVSANVSQCYQCNSIYCGDPFDTTLGAVASCSDVLRNAKMYSSQIVARAAALNIANDSQVGEDNSEDIETLSAQNVNEVIRQRSHAEFFDIQRKIREFFHKGDIDENTEFVCVKAFYYNNDTYQRKTYRGCVPKATKSISTACDFVSQRVAGGSKSSLSGCYTCDSNQCNSGISLKNSLFVLLVGIVLRIII